MQTVVRLESGDYITRLPAPPVTLWCDCRRFIFTQKSPIFSCDLYKSIYRFICCRKQNKRLKEQIFTVKEKGKDCQKKGKRKQAHVKKMKERLNSVFASGRLRQRRGRKKFPAGGPAYYDILLQPGAA